MDGDSQQIQNVAAHVVDGRNAGQNGRNNADPADDRIAGPSGRMADPTTADDDSSTKSTDSWCQGKPNRQNYDKVTDSERDHDSYRGNGPPMSRDHGMMDSRSRPSSDCHQPGFGLVSQIIDSYENQSKNESYSGDGMATSRGLVLSGRRVQDPSEIPPHGFGLDSYENYSRNDSYSRFGRSKMVNEQSKGVGEVRCQVPEDRRRSPETRCQVAENRRRIPEIRCQVPENRRRVPEVRCQEVRCQVPENWSRVAEDRCQVPENRCQVPEIRFQVPEIRSQSSERHRGPESYRSHGTIETHQPPVMVEDGQGCPDGYRGDTSQYRSAIPEIADQEKKERTLRRLLARIGVQQEEDPDEYRGGRYRPPIPEAIPQPPDTITHKGGTAQDLTYDRGPTEIRYDGDRDGYHGGRYRPPIPEAIPQPMSEASRRDGTGWDPSYNGGTVTSASQHQRALQCIEQIQQNLLSGQGAIHRPIEAKDMAQAPRITDRRPATDVLDGAGTHRTGFPYVKPREFDGTTDWTEYRKQFQVIARLNGWSRSEKALHLVSSLSGAALSVIYDLSEAQLDDWDEIVSRLEAKYNAVGREAAFQTQLRNSRRAPNQAPQEWAAEVSKLVYKAYPNLTGPARDEIVKENFLRGLPEGQMRLATEVSRPKTVEDAVNYVVCYESALSRSQSGPVRKPREVTVSLVEGESDTDTGLEEAGNTNLVGAAARPWRKPQAKPDGGSARAIPVVEQNTPNTRPAAETLIAELLESFKKILSEKTVTAQEFQPNRYGGPPPYGGAGYRILDVTCWRCQGKGHYSRDCATPRMDNPGRRNVDAVATTRDQGSGVGTTEGPKQEN